MGGFLEPPPDIPNSLLALMGISVAVPIISGGVSEIKYRTETPPTKERPKDQDMPGFATMLEEKDKPALTRFQMFS